MSGEPRDAAAELAESLEAAGGLIESLEAEVADLRRDLDGATSALRAAQERVSGRADASEDQERARREAERTVGELRAEISDLKRRHADEQVRLSNQHINELSNLRRTLEDQRRADVEAASSETRVVALKEEFDRERAALRQRHEAEVEALKTASEGWEEELRTGYRDQEDRHAAELEEVRRGARRRIEELETGRDEEVERRVAEEHASTRRRQEEALQALRDAAAGRELALREDYQAVVETQQAEIEALRRELDSGKREAEEERRRELKGIKASAENRERELRRAQTARLAEAGEDADRRVAALQAQREADNRALRARHAEELANLRREREERLLAGDERRKSETWALEERLREAGIRRDAEVRAYGARMTELEANRLAEKTAHEENLEKVVEGFGAEISTLERRVAELQEALEESERPREEPEDRAPARGSDDEPPAPDGTSREESGGKDADGRLEEIDARRVLAEERIQDLEEQLREAREESARSAEELDAALGSLRRLSEPGRRLREGLALFNESDHARAVASISKSFGLPRVHAGLDGDPPGKPTLTLLWGDVAWRRYVSDPTEGVAEPRVYLAGTGDDPAEIPEPQRDPNARMDSRGRLSLGVQAR